MIVANFEKGGKRNFYFICTCVYIMKKSVPRATNMKVISLGGVSEGKY